MPLLPINLNVKNAACLVVGGGKVAHRKCAALLECDALVTVVAPQLHAAFASLPIRFEHHQRVFLPHDCEGKRLIFACTNNNAVNLQVAKISLQAGIWCNVCDNAKKSTFHSAASVRQGDITIGIATNGQSPALARHLKSTIERCIGPEYGELTTLIAKYRKTANADWDDFFHSDVLEKVLLLLKRHDTDAAEAALCDYLK